jgi:hypothetical protein
LTKNQGPALPVWADGLLVQILVPLSMWLSTSELWASLLTFFWLSCRLGYGAPHERRRLLLAILFGALFEVALWKAGACFYQRPALLYVPLWIFPLWAAGGLMITGVAASVDWERPQGFIKWWALLPFALHCLLPSSWVSSLLAASVAVLTAALLWRGILEPPAWGRALRVLAVGLGGTSASWGFGYADICLFPQAWHGIPPWGISLWTSLAVVLLAFRK